MALLALLLTALPAEAPVPPGRQGPKQHGGKVEVDAARLVQPQQAEEVAGAGVCVTVTTAVTGSVTQDVDWQCLHEHYSHWQQQPSFAS